MAKSSHKKGKVWSAKDTKQLQSLAKANTPARVIGLKLGRTEEAVRSKASVLGISLKPTNRSPYSSKEPKSSKPAEQFYQTETTVAGDGSITIRDIPFAEGETVEVIVRPHEPARPAASEARSLHGSVQRYMGPFEPATDSTSWDAARGA